MDSWNKINDILLRQIQYGYLPELLALGIAYAHFNNIKLNCSFDAYLNNVRSLFNILNYEVDMKKIVNNTLNTRYNLNIINYDLLETVSIEYN